MSGGEEITPAEGTTQRDPTAVPIYGLWYLLLSNVTADNTKQAAYANDNDISCVGKLKNMLTWWNKLNTFGPNIGYFPKAKKSWLIVKLEKYETAKGIFKDTKLNIIVI